MIVVFCTCWSKFLKVILFCTVFLYWRLLLLLYSLISFFRLYLSISQIKWSLFKVSYFDSYIDLKGLFSESYYNIISDYLNFLDTIPLFYDLFLEYYTLNLNNVRKINNIYEVKGFLYDISPPRPILNLVILFSSLYSLHIYSDY